MSEKIKKELDDDETVQGLLGRISSLLETFLSRSGTSHGRMSASTYDEIGDDAYFSMTIDISKSDDEAQIVYGVAMEPDTPDGSEHEDMISAEEIEKTAHRFMAEYGEQEAEMGLEHAFVVNRKSVRVVESFIAPADFKLNKKKVKKGSWVVAAHVADDELWKAVTDGQFTGFSIGGKGMRVAA